MQLTKVVTKRKKTIGRGRGSGKGGHTVGRGQKGQKSRGDLNVLFEGLKMKKSLIKRLPLMRGMGRFKSSVKSMAVDVKRLDSLKDGSVLSLETLIKNKIVKANNAIKYGVKIVGKSKVTKKFKLELPASESAKQQIQKAGGTV